MNDSQLLERLARSNLYPDEVGLPETMRPDVVLLEIARRMEMDTMEHTPVEVVKPPRRKWNGPLIAVAAFAVVIVVGIAGILFTDGDDGGDAANPGTTVTSAAPAIDTEAGAAVLLGETWTVVGGRSFSRPTRIEFAADGGYRVFDAGLPVDTGVSTTDGEVITFESDPTDEVTWVFNSADIRVTDPCEGVVGQYRVAFTDSARVTLEVIKDGCGPRIGVANGLQLEPAQP